MLLLKGCACGGPLAGIDQTIEVTCGSSLARESAGSVNMYVECQSAFASKPAPTLVLYEPDKSR
ncbi:hypothetical protein C7U57_19225 [Pseudomonas sp. R9.37]|nr:hypothetical protein C7U57_19225 [Pseudomonas sp. R9.37]